MTTPSRFRVTTIAYLVPSALQASLGFVVVSVLARHYGVESLANWGLQQVYYQAAGILLGFGLPPILATQFVRSAHEPINAGDRYHLASVTTATATICLAGLIVVLSQVLDGPPLWHVTLAAGLTALAQLRSARLRGEERHRSNVFFLSMLAVLSGGLGIGTLFLSDDVGSYWLGIAAGTAFVLVAVPSGRSSIRDVRVLATDWRFLSSGVRALPHLTANTLLIGSLRPLAGLAGGAEAVAAMTIATQYSQLASVLQNAYWSVKTPVALKVLLAGEGTKVIRLVRDALGAMTLISGATVLAAPVILLALMGETPTVELLIASTLLLLLPICSVIYDVHSSLMWRSMRTATLSTVSIAGLAASVALSYAIGATVGYIYIPIGVLLIRIIQGQVVKGLIARTIE